MKYLLGLKGKKTLTLAGLEGGDSRACAFAVKRTRTKINSLGTAYDPEFSVAAEKKFGAWTVQNLKVSDNFSGQPLPTFRQSAGEGDNKDRVYWKNIFGEIAKKPMN